MPQLRVVSLLPAASDIVVSLQLSSLLVGRSHECDWPELQHLPALTSSRVGEIPVADIDAAMSAGAAAVRELAQLGTALAGPLLEFGLGVYHTHTDALRALRPDVVLTCLQDAHGAQLHGELLDAALRTVLGAAPRVVHCCAADLAGVWRDVQAVADALGVPDQGRQLVQRQRQQLEDVAASARGRVAPRVACLQWAEPPMACSAWVPELVRMAGARDVCGAVDHAEVLTEHALRAAAPDVVVWALCGLGLEDSAREARGAAARLGDAWVGLPAVRHGRVAVADGTRVLSRPGPWLLRSLEVLLEVLHPEAQPHGHQGRLWRWLEGPGGEASAPA